MNNKSLVKLSNAIGIISIILLVYWVFVFTSVTVFGLKVFRENLTESFYLSVIGILALMFGALIINVMCNLTRIAEKHNGDELKLANTPSKKTFYAFTISFPVIFLLLLGGNYLTSSKKEKMLIASAKSIIEENPSRTIKLLNYSFNETWISETSDAIELYSKTDEHFSHISVIIRDSIGNTPVFLGFNDYYKSADKLGPKKGDFIQQTTKEEREYLKGVFEKGSTEIKFSAKDGQYELFYPYLKNGKRIVLYFADYQRYGKIGSS